VDDESAITDDFTLFLERSRLAVTTASNDKQALKAAAGKKRPDR
jgi:DNA-binding response OmpR family regulator